MALRTRSVPGLVFAALASGFVSVRPGSPAPARVIAVPADSVVRTRRGVDFTTDSMNVRISLYGASTVRVLKTPRGRTSTRKSLSVIKTPEDVDFDVARDEGRVTLSTSRLMVTADLKSGTVSYRTAEGSPLLAEQEGAASFEPVLDVGQPTYRVGQGFVLDAGEAIYGLGQQQSGRMDQRHQTLRMIQGNTDDYVPFFQSIKGYGLFWDNYSPTTFADESGDTSFKSDVGEEIDYYFMFGGDADGVVAQMRDLTGDAPMLPLWTFGYWQSKERYKSQDETVGVVRRYRELGVPLDGIIQDWQYWGDNDHWNAMEFLNPAFPDPHRMIDEIHGMNAHLIISIWSSFGPKTPQYAELEKIGALLDFPTWPLSARDTWPPDMSVPSGVEVYDPYNPKARDIYWRYLQKGLFSLGVDGWWMDSTEPDHLNPKPADLDNMTYLGSFRRVRNAYPLMTVGGVYTHQRAVESDKRVFILTRSAFAGQQRYGANTWSGDVVASWKALRNQISAGLNFSLCGLPYWNSDIGGFFLWGYPHKLDDAEYRELYTRWLEFGAFTPMMRSHGTDAPREIYQFGEKGTRTYDAIEKFIDLRYRLLPYLYATAWDVTRHRSSMMRALVMDFPQDEAVRNLDDEYMFGRSLLVRPVTEPMYSRVGPDGEESAHVEDFGRVGSVQVYLPAGTDWFDFWTGERLAGGRRVEREVPLDIMPLYVRAGSILPAGPEVQYATEKSWAELDVKVYPGADGRFVLYEDENDNYDYENGAFSTIEFRWDDDARQLHIGERSGSFRGMVPERVFHVTLADGNGGRRESGAPVAVRYDGSARTVRF